MLDCGADEGGAKTSFGASESMLNGVGDFVPGTVILPVLAFCRNRVVDSVGNNDGVNAYMRTVGPLGDMNGT